MPAIVGRRAGPHAMPALNTVLTWALLLAAVAAGYVSYGWRGVVLAVTVVVFWMLLQLSRSLRALRAAAGRPVGQVPSAVMLHARLHRGMRLVQILALTRSLGVRLSDEPETWCWRDEAGDEVRVELRDGRLAAWDLKRAAA